MFGRARRCAARGVRARGVKPQIGPHVAPSQSRSLRYALAAFALTSSACAPSTSVQRVSHGRTVEGPEVGADAYAAYAHGAYLEARGQPTAAIQAYREALDSGSAKPAIWTRLGALYCREPTRDAEAAFDNAIGLDEGYAPAWSGRAECRYSRRELDAALTDALRAVRLDADDTAANLLVARIYRAQNRLADAKAWLFALVLKSPEVRAHWVALDAFVAASHDEALAGYTRAQLARRSAGAQLTTDAEGRGRQAPPTLSNELRQALNEDDLPRARAIATEEGVNARTLGLLAASNGYAALADRQATLVLEADPSDPDALIVALAVAQANGATERLRSLLQRANTVGRPSPLGARLLGDLIRWLVDERAEQGWLDAYGPRPSPPR